MTQTEAEIVEGIGSDYAIKYGFSVTEDYFYISLTNATAFSPTDSMPLTRPAKALMAAESMLSVVTVLLVAARAVNILV